MTTPGWRAPTAPPWLTYLQQLSGYSRAQVTRLVSRWDARAKAALGDKLDNGALPLATLETLIDAWIAGELATAKAPA